MTCLVTKGRLEPCKSSIGGLYKVWFANYGTNSGSTVYDSDNYSVTGWTKAQTIYEYELKGTNTFVQTMTSSRENGTTFVNQTLTLTLKGLDAATHNEIKLLAYGRPYIIVQDNNGNAWLMGKDFGAELQTSDASTGTALGDPYAYTMTFVANEKLYANPIAGATLESLFDANFRDAPTIVKGS